MYLEESMVQVVIHLLRTTVEVPVCIAGGDWRIWALTDERQREKARYLLELCAEGGGWQELAAAFSVYIHPCRIEDELLCYIIVFHRRGELLAAYTETLLLAEYSAHTRSHMELEARKRGLLANQLAGSGQIDSEMESYFRSLGCTGDIPRCAVLCALTRTGEHGLLPGDGGLMAVVMRWARDAGLFSPEDIYGQMNTGLLLIFKAVSSLDYTSYQEEVEALALTLSDCIRERTGGAVRIRACVGSAYDRAAQLHRSYGEANYLYSNLDYYGRRGENCVFINHYIFEYLYSSLDGGLQRNLVQDLREMLEDSPAISETAIALAGNNSSPIRCARELNIHRNTVLQRLQKMKSGMALDPLYSAKDRVAIHVYALQKTKKTIWNGGIIVQPGSALYQGLKHLADLLYQNSGGTFQINIHTISTSGDNYRLVNMLATGGLDLVVASTIALRPYTDARVSTLQLPFLFDSEEEAEYILDQTALPELKGSLGEAGILCPSIWSMGWRYLTSRDTPIRVPGDLKGRRIRILASDNIESYFNSLGAVPLKIYYNNIKEALACNIISCQENPYSNILGMEFYKYQDFVTELRLWYSMEALCLSQSAYRELDPNHQELLRRAIDESTRWLRQKKREMNEQARQELVRRGMTIITPTQAEKELWRETARTLYAREKNQAFLVKIQEAKRQYEKKRN